MIEPIDVVHVGSASRDLTTNDPRGWRLGGGVAYAALTTARLGMRTAAIVGADDDAASAWEIEDLRAAGVDVRIARIAEGPVFRNDMGPGGRAQGCLQVGLPVPRFAATDLPDSWRAARCVSFVPIAGELGDAWASIIASGTLVVLGWQGLLRRLRAGSAVGRRAPRASGLVRRADLIGVSAEDLGPGRSAESVAAFIPPAARLVVTDADRGGVVVEAAVGERRRSWRYAAFPAARIVDPTGAGDVFLATLAAAMVRPDILGRREETSGWDVRFAAAAASLAVEGIGLAGVPDRAAVMRRFNGG